MLLQIIAAPTGVAAEPFKSVGHIVQICETRSSGVKRKLPDQQREIDAILARRGRAASRRRIAQPLLGACQTFTRQRHKITHYLILPGPQYEPPRLTSAYKRSRRSPL